MHRDRVAALKRKLGQGKSSIGSWVNMGEPIAVEVMAGCGFEWIVIDLEHTTTSLPQAIALIRVVEAEGMVPFVRLTSNDPDQIKRVMDAGAGGILVPMVSTRDEAEAAVAAVRYPPLGTRGVGLARAQEYGVAFAEAMAFANNDSIVILQIEHIDAIRDLEAILSVDGVDGTIIGPYDLSGSLGRAGQLDDPLVTEALHAYERISLACGKPMGYHVVNPEPAKAADLLSRGYGIIAFGVDFTFLGSTCRNAMADLQGRITNQ